MIVDGAENNSSEVTQIANCNVIQSYIYLGDLISNNGGYIDEVKLRMLITRTEMDKMRKIWRIRNISKPTKSEFVRTLIFSILLCTAENWTLRDVERHKTNALEM